MSMRYSRREWKHLNTRQRLMRAQKELYHAQRKELAKFAVRLQKAPRRKGGVS